MFQFRQVLVRLRAGDTAREIALHPSALTMRFLSVASHFLHSGFVQTVPRGLALAFGSWLSLPTR